ncbi:penicillin acylase family protein [Crossiella sp. SN42]|uniref:penicillin acylase family protein n=1 Tax=Crossiella sp. SN42 TaxID=2944808 RepID=UPI00207CD2F1|nr:penicillin acylase family protein [Crossiella sp. SN42]MCO1577251.1 penicillin acylase family protein [Crossiella sp. SN42]
MRIEWDRWAVPTITGDDELDVTYGTGHAQAVTNASLVLRLYGTARGTAAALWGPDFVAEDRFTAELGLRSATEVWFQAQAKQTVDRIAAFCAGFNAACAENTGLGGEFRAVLPVTPEDVVAHMLRVFVRFTTMDAKGLAFRPESFAESAGSNGWAVSAARSATGNALLVINPHLVWRGYQRFFEYRSVSPGREFHGISLIGLPWQNMGYNPAVGWGHTVNPIPNMSVYQLDLTEEGYLFDGQRRALHQVEHRIEVRGADPVTVVERRTVHGPVVTAPDGAQVAVRVAGVLHHPTTSALESWWRMSLATSVQEVIAQQEEMPLPLFTLVTADAHGSIGALFCGTPPVRVAGDFDDSRRRLPGEDPRWLWEDVHPAAAMPRVVNPESGWVQNCNETPFLFTSPPLDARDWPSAIAPSVRQVDDLRSVVSRNWLAAQQKITPEAVLGLKFSKRALLADIVLDELCQAASAEEDLREAAKVLTTWDRCANQDSNGYVLFFFWAALNFAELADKSLFRAESEPGAVPTGLADPAAAVAKLRIAVATLTALGLPVDAAIGEICTLGSGPDAVPADGGSGLVGVLKSLEIGAAEHGIKLVLGDTWVSLVEFRPGGGTTARSLLVYGNTTEPGAPPAKSQFAVWAADRLRE